MNLSFFVNKLHMYIFPLNVGNACVNEKSLVIATIDKNGKININAKRQNNNYSNIKIPFFRGIAYFLFGIYLFFENLLNAKDLENKNTKKSKLFSNITILTVSLLVGFLIGFVGIVLVPYFSLKFLGREGISYGLICLYSALIRLALLSVILGVCKLVPSYRQFCRHNSAGNLAFKMVNNIDNESYHLSTNFLSFSITCFYVLIFCLSFTALNINYFLKLLLNLAIMFVVIGGLYEFLKFLENKNGILNSIFVNPFSFFVTNKPSSTEINIANSAVGEVKLMQENKDRLIEEISGKEIPMSVVISEVKGKLLKAGIESSAEAEWLIAESLNKKRNDIRLQTTINKEEYKKIIWATSKREKHIPLSKIFNRACFYGLDFYVDKNVLSPRPETEILVEEIIKEIKNSENKKINVLDLCTGSGCIAITIAKNTNAKVYAIDVSENALNVAKKNAEAHNVNVKFINSDLFSNLKKEKFDYIISNPPYICSKDILALEDEVKKNDPLISLDGGEDGLYFYKEIAKHAPNYLNKNGKIFLEIGINQAKSVKKLLQNNFENIKIKKDYSGIDRVVIADLKGKI